MGFAVLVGPRLWQTTTLRMVSGLEGRPRQLLATESGRAARSEGSRYRDGVPPMCSSAYERARHHGLTCEMKASLFGETRLVVIAAEMLDITERCIANPAIIRVSASASRWTGTGARPKSFCRRTASNLDARCGAMRIEIKRIHQRLRTPSATLPDHARP